MEKWQTDFFLSFPTLLTLSLGSSFSSLSALSVPCAVWRCALLLPWQGTLFHRCSQNLWPNVMLPLWANKMGQLVFRVIITTTVMIMLTEFLPLLKKNNNTITNHFCRHSFPISVIDFSPFSLIMLSHHMVPARRQGGYSSHYKILVKTFVFSSLQYPPVSTGQLLRFCKPSPSLIFKAWKWDKGKDISLWRSEIQPSVLYFSISKRGISFYPRKELWW